MRTIVLLLISSILFISCKKDNSSTDPTPPPPPISTNDITMITTSAVPGEIVVAQANYQLTKDTATILVGDKLVLALKTDSNRIAFVLPALQQNSTAIIKYDKMGLAKQLNINVGSYSTITQPDVIYNQFITEQNETQQLFAKYESDTIINLNPQFRQVLQYLQQNLASHYTGLTNDQKIEVAYALRNNMINDQDYVIDIKNPLFFARLQSDPGDAGDASNGFIANILAACITSGGQMLMGGALVAGGAAMITLGPDPFTKGLGVVTAGAGVILFIKGANSYIEAHGNAEALKNMLSVRALGFDWLRTNATPIAFTKDLEKSVSFYGQFRTINNSDVTSSNLLIKEAFGCKTKLEEIKPVAENAYNQTKMFLIGNPPVLPTKAPEFGNTSISRMLIMQGAKLSVTNVSNPAITLSYVKEAGGLKIKASSASITQQTPFTFDLVYTNNNTGTVIKDKIDAIFTVCDPAKPEPPVITGVNTLCVGNAAVDVSFTAPGTGILIGSSYFGTCDFTETCYAVRLEWYDARQVNPKWELAANGYDVTLISGTVKDGVVRIKVKSSWCTPTPREFLTQGGVRWRVYLMNACNQRSNMIEI